ncbi:hypothetical protein N234_33240 [Ralstonia pickettii DTP0602]|nr:hypothetical protein N234_33240 [Ralstonia pickettii DTP0602]
MADMLAPFRSSDGFGPQRSAGGAALPRMD